jgi:hypothetical protein
MSRIQEIRQRIIDRDYYLSSHIEAEMIEDRLERMDIENAVHKGRIEKKLTHDVRGTRYRLEGPAKDGRLIHVIRRFKEEGSLIIITVYTVMEEI